MGAEEAFGQVFSDDFDKQDASAMNPSVGKLLAYFEAIGTLVKHSLLDRDLVTDLWSSRMIWDRLGPAALRAREAAGEPRLFENFEALAKASPGQ
jgi:hypothetical protein